MLKIKQYFTNLANSRFGSINILILVFLLIALIVRISLLFFSVRVVSWDPIEIAKIFIGGLIYDVVAALYFVLPLSILTILIPSKIYKSKIHKGLTYFIFTFMTFLMVFSAISEWFFWDEFQVRYNFIAVDYLVYTTEVVKNIIESYPIHIILPALFTVAGFIVYLCRKRINTALQSNSNFRQRAQYGFIYVLLPLLFFFSINGSWERLSYNKYNNELAKNGIYSIFEAFWGNEINYQDFYITHDNNYNFVKLRTLLKSPNTNFVSNIPFIIDRQVQPDSSEKRMNVIMIAVESLSGEFLKHFGNTDNLTPNLDSLADAGILGENYFATGTRTVRGLEALMLSVPPMPGASIVRRDNNENLFTMATPYQKRGYDLKFIYGGVGFFDNMNYFFKNNGFTICDKPTFAKNEQTFSNAWGLCDEDLYSKTITEADKSYKNGKNFFSFVLTTSNHRPYTFPKGKINMPFNREGAVAYTDYSIGKLIKIAKTKPWFKNTIFVISADHCANSAGKTELPIDKYKIPLIIYSPGNIKPMHIKTTISQIDVAPTIAGIMNINYRSKFLGKDILKMKSNEGRAFISNYQKIGYVKDNKIIVLELKKQKRLYEYDMKTLEMQIDINDNNSNLLLDEAVSFYQSTFFLFKNGYMKF